MGENSYMEAAKNARNWADRASESLRQHSYDLGKKLRSGENARDRLRDGQERPAQTGSRKAAANCGV
jgi:hypothetical protein